MAVAAFWTACYPLLSVGFGGTVQVFNVSGEDLRADVPGVLVDSFGYFITITMCLCSSQEAITCKPKDAVLVKAVVDFGCNS